jgi:hypothetical protein
MILKSWNDKTWRTYNDTAAADDTPLKDKYVEEGGGCRKGAEDQEPETQTIAALLLENAVVLVGSKGSFVSFEVLLWGLIQVYVTERKEPGEDGEYYLGQVGDYDGDEDEDRESEFWLVVSRCTYSSYSSSIWRL